MTSEPPPLGRDRFGDLRWELIQAMGERIPPTDVTDPALLAEAVLPIIESYMQGDQ